MMDNKQSILGMTETSTQQMPLNAISQMSIQKIEQNVPERPKPLKINSAVPITKNFTELQSSSKNYSLPNISVQQTNAMQSMQQSAIQSIPQMANAIPPEIQKSQMPSQADVLKFNEQQSKELKKKFEEQLKNKERAKIFTALQPAFQNIESALKFQAQMMKKDKDFDTPHYTVPLTQSQFNLTANQITNMPSWRN
jgi:hypothetical protein